MNLKNIILVVLSFIFIWGCQNSTSVPDQVFGQPGIEVMCIDESESPPTKFPFVKRMILVVLENTDEEIALKAPYLNEIVQRGSYLSEYHALYHPSQPNYLAMIGGSAFNHYSNEPIDLENMNLADLIEKSGRSWKIFAENFPGNCYLGDDAEPYSRRHNPFMSFTNITQNPERCKNITNASSFISDWKENRLPNFSFYIPNNKNNGHDTGVEVASKWMKDTFDELLKDPVLMKDTLFMVVFDEGSGSTNNQNRTYTLFLGPMVKSNFVTNRCHNHYSLLHTIEEMWGLGDLGQFDKSANLINEIWIEN